MTTNKFWSIITSPTKCFLYLFPHLSTKLKQCRNMTKFKITRVKKNLVYFCKVNFLLWWLVCYFVLSINVYFHTIQEFHHLKWVQKNEIQSVKIRSQVLSYQVLSSSHAKNWSISSLWGDGVEVSLEFNNFLSSNWFW